LVFIVSAAHQREGKQSAETNKPAHSHPGTQHASSTLCKLRNNTHYRNNQIKKNVCVMNVSEINLTMISFDATLIHADEDFQTPRC